MAQQPKQVRIDQLPPQQLAGLKQQLEEELQGLQQSAVTLQNVASEFHQSGEAIQHLAEQKVGAQHRSHSAALYLQSRSNLHSKLQTCLCWLDAGLRQPPEWRRPIAGQPMLLPLSQSLYVEGELADADSVLLDIGTGYYLEVRKLATRMISI